MNGISYFTRILGAAYAQSAAAAATLAAAARAGSTGTGTAAIVNSQSQAAAAAAMSAAAAQSLLPASAASATAVPGFSLQTAQLASLGQFGAMTGDPYLTAAAIGVTPSVAYVSLLFLLLQYLAVDPKSILR